MKSIGLVAALAASGLVLLAALSGRLPWHHGMNQQHRGMMGRLPAEYQQRENPQPRTQQSVATGGELYQALCAACHGTNGRGDGPAGKQLSPKPVDLVSQIRMPMVNDSYLFWVISEGGTSRGTAMPAFKEVLSENQRWHLINFLGTL